MPGCKKVGGRAEEDNAPTRIPPRGVAGVARGLNFGAAGGVGETARASTAGVGGEGPRFCCARTKGCCMIVYVCRVIKNERMIVKMLFRKLYPISGRNFRSDRNSVQISSPVAAGATKSHPCSSGVVQARSESWKKRREGCDVAHQNANSEQIYLPPLVTFFYSADPSCRTILDRNRCNFFHSFRN